MENLSVRERTAQEIVVEIKTTLEYVNRTAIDGAIIIGRNLQDLKAQIPHGEWGAYIEENLGFSDRKARQFIQIAETYGNKDSEYFQVITKRHTCADLDLSKYLKLLVVPEDDVKEFVEANPVEDMTVKELEKTIAEYKSQTQDLSILIDDLKIDRDNLIAELETYKLDHPQDMDLGGQVPEEVLSEREAEIEKLKKKLESVESKLKKATEDQESEIKRKVESAYADGKAEATKQAEESIEILRLKAQEAKEEAAILLKKLESSSNENILLFKLKVDELQEALTEALCAINEVSDVDAEQSQKMRAALRTVMEHMLERVQ